MHDDAVARREDQGALDDVAQLADIARPVVRLERGHRFFRDGRRRHPPLGREAREEMADQLGDVLAPLAQRRKAHRHDVEAVEEVLAEAPGGDLVLQVARRRRKHAHVDLDRPLAADPVIALVGEHAQDLRLRRQRHVGDLVEEQGAAVRMFEQARADHAVGLAAEQFLLDPLGAHHRRRKDDEGRLGARAPLVDHPRGDFLADARRARDQHPAAGRRDALQGRADRVDRDRTAVELVFLADLLAQRLVLAPQPVGLGGAVDEVDQPLGLERLLDEVDGPFPHRGDRRVEIAVAGDHQHRDRRSRAA